MDNNNRSDSSYSESNLEAEELELEALELAMALRRVEYYQNRNKMPCYTCGLTGYAFIQELINGHPDRMYNMFRMDTPVFLNLCQTLEQSQLLEDDKHVTLIEAVVICLYILSHGAVMRVVAERFQWSKDTIYRQFKRVLKGLCGLAPHIIREQNRGQQPPLPEIRDKPKFYPYFKCFGVLKACFAILKHMPNYRLPRQHLIPIACCVLHNFIQSQSRGDRMFREYENVDMLIDGEAEGRPNPNIDLSPSNVALMSNVRDEIAKKMWRDCSHNKR
ncbi:hypothetical protein Dsin_026679 [Dipteronia sinensis]|uniref:DUF8040 domain-containing protein n=1 Tax=Dipteronia sinensis TaxID=43782 RepID=A0AAD9ZZ38_9ROSI|nr:hypothetical protein Dsin_026679 [Dipteronia sinensis]